MKMRIDHVMFRTESMVDSMKFWHDALGMELFAIDDREEYVSYFIGYRDEDGEVAFKIELTYNSLRKNFEIGEAVDHLAIYTDDHDEVMRNLHLIKCSFSLDIHSHGEKKYIMVNTVSPEGVSIVIVHKTEG